MKQNRTSSDALEELQVQAQEWGKLLKTSQLSILGQYAELLAQYEQANVIGTQDVQNIITEHILDSLSCVVFKDLGHQESLIDVGSGGGLPGIPLSIAYPSLSVTLLEATRKKTSFLENACRVLQLRNLWVLNERAEETSRDPRLRDRYGVAVSRALASLPVVVEYCAPFVRKGGFILAMKGRVRDDELIAGLGAAPVLGAVHEKTLTVPIRPELVQKQRQIVVFRKVSPTPAGYPRRVGLAKKRPLGS